MLSERLEHRLPMDASFSFGGSTLTLNQFTEVQEENVTFSQSGGALIVELSEGRFSGSDGSGATLVNDSTLRLSPAAVDQMTSITINDGSVGSGADPGVQLGDLDLEQIAITLNGTGRLTSQSGSTALFDAVLANVSDADIMGTLEIDDDESLAITTQNDLIVSGTLGSDGSTIDLTAGGVFSGDGTITSEPQLGDGGNIMLTLQTGSTFTGVIDASGSRGQDATPSQSATVGGTGGNITVSQVSSATQSMQLGRVQSNGGDGGVDAGDQGRSSADGGDGGGVSITVNGGGDLQAERIESRGGDGGRRTGASGNAGGGGTAGNLNITAGSIDVTTLRATGGRGGDADSPGNGGSGGSGGSITASASDSDNRAIDLTTVDADAGRGGDANGTGNGGDGGDAGNISLTSNQSAIVAQTVRAGGGRGGDADSGRGGNGGSGNSIGLSAATILVVRDLRSTGGNGGVSASGIGGNGGSGGGITASGDRRAEIRMLNTSGGEGQGSTGGNGGDAGNATVESSRGLLRVRSADATGGRGQNNGGDGGTLTFSARREILGNLQVEGGVGVSGNDGDDGSVQ